MFIEIKRTQVKQFVLSKLTDGTGKILNIGVAPFANLSSLAVPSKLPADDSPAYLSIIQFDDDPLKLFQIGRNMLDDLKLYDQRDRIDQAFKDYTNVGGARSRRVRCIDTGEIFPSMISAATVHDISYSALHKHLHKVKSYNTVKGRCYEYF